MKNDILTEDFGITIYDKIVDFLFVKNRNHFLPNQYCQDCKVSTYNNTTASTFDLEVVVVNLSIYDMYFDLLKPEFVKKFKIDELPNIDELDWDSEENGDYVDLSKLNIMIRIRLPYSDDKYMIDVQITTNTEDCYYWRDTATTNVSLSHELDDILSTIMKIEKSSYTNI